MPIKAEVTTDDALSINSSNLNLNGVAEVEAALTGSSTATTAHSIGSSSTMKSSQIPTKINPVKDKSSVNDSKMIRFDGGEQQIIVS